MALLFRGLVRLGPDSTVTGDLASRWDVDQSGRTWTFHLRPDQFWEDGEPITAEDVAFTVDVLSDPALHGSGGESWQDVSATVARSTDGPAASITPLGGFLQAATQPIAPGAPAGGRPGRADRRGPVRPEAGRVGAVPPRVPAHRPGAAGRRDPGRTAARRSGRAELLDPAARPTRWHRRSRHQARMSPSRTWLSSSCATTTMSNRSGQRGTRATSTPHRASSRPTARALAATAAAAS